MAKIAYRTAVAERALDRPRAEVWRRVEASMPGRKLSVEPPWRIVAEHPDRSALLCETTVTIRDDGDRCLVAWCALVHPGTDGIDELMATMADEGEQMLQGLVEPSP